MNIKNLIASMTLEEKAGLCSGNGFWFTKAVERLGIPAIMVSDGPHGLRKQDVEKDPFNFNQSIKAVCFPTGSATASSFDKELVNVMGKALGDACQAENVAVLLGPAVNIKRSPLCGRNFEYFSEDPYLTSTIATSYTKGVQSKHIGTSLKHFLANNQEHRRMTSSSEVDERTLRELYLAAFEGVVKDAKPWSVMSAYNRVNGVYASENHRYLTEVLRDEWKFDGFVVSDWGAVNDRVEGLKAGLELEMPSFTGINDRRIVKAVENNELDMAILDQAVERLLTIANKYLSNRDANATWDLDEHHELSRKISSECMVLLKNDNILPLNKNSKIAFIGEFASKPRYQGGGSSHINSHKTSSAIEAAKFESIHYARGYQTDVDATFEELVNEAVQLAKSVEIAVVFAGLPDFFESEGYDRTHMSLPQCQNHLINEVLKVQPNTIIVLHNGSPVEMPWINEVKGVLEVYLGGQAVGEATVDVLFGDVNPSGRLAETFPLKVQDNPSYLFYLGEEDKVEYREGVFVGYRYYDKKDMNVLFPFGHGLSYTSFDYSNLKIDKTTIQDEETLSVSVDVKNSGKIFGKEVVQLYVAPQNSSIIRPIRELKGYDKVSLEPGETKTVKFTLNKRSFAYYETKINDWYVEDGSYAIEIGRSSRDIKLNELVEYSNTKRLPVSYTINSTFGDIMKDPVASEFLKTFLDVSGSIFGSTEETAEGDEAITKEMQEAMLRYLPLRGLISFSQNGLTHEMLEEELIKLNQKLK